jgi:Septum formation initiator
VGSAAFAAVVLATSMPVSALLAQHGKLSQTSAQLRALEAQNRTLSQEAKALTDPSTVAGIARRDYGLVSPGSQAYEILPPAGSSAAAAQGTGYVPLNGPPVVPGSARSQQLIGASELSQVASPASGSGGGTASQPREDASRSDPSAPDPSSRAGFWSRVASSLEFWR